jgi:hypothetical protein
VYATEAPRALQMAAEEDMFRAAGLSSDDGSDDEPVVERHDADASRFGGSRSGLLDAPEAGTEEVLDDTEQVAVDTDPGGLVESGRKADPLKAAGLQDTDEEGDDDPKGSGSPDPEVDDDHLDAAPTTEDLPKPGAVHRISGPPEVCVPIDLWDIFSALGVAILVHG